MAPSDEVLAQLIYKQNKVFCRCICWHIFVMLTQYVSGWLQANKLSQVLANIFYYAFLLFVAVLLLLQPSWRSGLISSCLPHFVRDSFFTEDNSLPLYLSCVRANAMIWTRRIVMVFIVRNVNSYPLVSCSAFWGFTMMWHNRLMKLIMSISWNSTTLYPHSPRHCTEING